MIRVVEIGHVPHRGPGTEIVSAMPRPVDFHLRSSCDRAGKQQTYPYHCWQPELSKHRGLHPTELLGLGSVSMSSWVDCQSRKYRRVRSNLCLIAVPAPLFSARGCS